MPDHRQIFSMTPAERYSISAGRHLYLDTSVIRRLGTKLWSVPRIAETYTSVLTLIELLSDIMRNEKEFHTRRSAIAGIMAGRVEIDWQMPDVRVKCAFDLLRPKYDIYESAVQGIQELLDCLSGADTLEDFRRREKEVGREFGVSYFQQIDCDISTSSLASFRKWAGYNRAQWQSGSPAALLKELGLPEDLSLREAATVLGGSTFDVGLGVYAITKRFTEAEGGDHEYHDRLFRSYDHSLDLYMRAESRQLWREVGFADSPGRNTAVDLTHLRYVADNSFVVTADDGMAAQVVGANGAVMTLAELLAA